VTDPVAARLADRLAIGDLAHAYADAVDRRDLDAVTRLFTPDCAYEGRLGIGTIADALTVLRDAFTRYVRTMHCMSTQLVTVDGDCGRAETACVAYHVRPNGRHFTVGVRYRDDVVRTPEGWKIAHRVVETLWSREDDPGDVSPR
jgi:ketosteroid isomerase-like protein